MLLSRRWMLAAIVGFSLATHLKGAAAPVLDYHYHRQANTAAIARNYYRERLPPWQPRIDWAGADSGRAATELPLYMWLTGLLWPLLGLGAVWGRLLSIACSAATAALLFAFLERRPERTGWIDREPAFWAALAFSALPVEVYFGRTVQPEALALLCSIAALHAMDRYLVASRPGWWLATVLAAACAIGHKLPYVYLLGVLGLLALVRRGRPALKDWRLWAMAAAIAGLVFAWYRYAAGGTFVVPTTESGVFLMLLDYRRLPYYVFFQTFSRLPELALTYPGLLLFAAGAREVRRRGLWFLAGWWACVYAYVVAGGGYVHYHEYTALPWAPVNAAFIGLGLAALRAAASSRATRAGVAALVLGMPVHAALRIHHWYRWSHDYVLSLKPITDKLSAPEDLFICNERASSLVLFFIDRRGWSWNLAEAGEGSYRWTEEKIALGARYLVTEKADAFARRDAPFASWYFRRFPVVYEDPRVVILRLS